MGYSFLIFLRIIILLVFFIVDSDGLDGEEGGRKFVELVFRIYLGLVGCG